MTCEATHNATSSPVSVDGAPACALQDGPTTDLFGLEVAHASPSAQRANSVAATMYATYGLRSSGSLQSVRLQQSLANRLQALLASRGSTMYALTWKAVATPQRRQLCQLVASGLPIGVTDCGGRPMPTPTATDWKRTPIKMEYADRTIRTNGTDDLAKWALRASGIPHGRLVPDLWRWAMGYPESWDDCAPTETQSCRK